MSEECPTISLLTVARFINFRRSGCLDRDLAGSVCDTLISIADNVTLAYIRVLAVTCNTTDSIYSQ